MTAREATAYHEAGHAFAAWVLGLPIKRISIRPDGDAKGFVQHRSPLAGIRLDIDNSDRARLKAEKAILICLAGPAAQRKFNPRSYRKHHAASDFDLAGDLALRLNSSGEAASAHLAWLQIRAADLVSARWHVVSAVARLLLEREELGPNGVPEAIQAAIARRSENKTVIVP